MSTLAIAVIVAIAFCMWLGSTIWAFEQIPSSARPEFQELRENPHLNQIRLWAFLQKYYDVKDFLPDIARRDWLLLGVLVLISLPIVVLGGLYASRPLSRQFSAIAQAARKVAHGEFSARSPIFYGAPNELTKLAEDFNGMTIKLEQYEREIRVSSAVLAHELRTPLNAAMGRIQGMADGVFPSDSLQLLLVKGQLDQLNRLVGDLHLLSLARAGQLAMENRQFSLHELVMERLEWAGPQIAEAGISPEVRVPLGLTLIADRDRLGQALSILIDNLLCYAQHGKCLEVSATSYQTYLQLEIADRGPGIEEDQLPRMFDRFWRAENSRARPLGGTGLGLSIASAIFDAHGGSVSALNREGGGLVVRAIIPLCK